ncbi:MAG: hypothetical protein IPH50_08940 [Rhodanobacteraceae bacterium]|nr:hypothetical protein [Rhodanobacteraceae bacterium]
MEILVFVGIFGLIFSVLGRIAMIVVARRMANEELRPISSLDLLPPNMPCEMVRSLAAMRCAWLAGGLLSALATLSGAGYVVCIAVLIIGTWLKFIA